jgi:hypothetical protein
MKLVIEIPAQYAVATRRELKRRGYRHDPAEVRRVLRRALEQTADRHWWPKVGVAFYWGAGDGG